MYIMFRPQPFQAGFSRPPVNTMKFGGLAKPINAGSPQVYQQVAKAQNTAKNSIERIKHKI